MAFKFVRISQGMQFLWSGFCFVGNDWEWQWILKVRTRMNRHQFLKSDPSFEASNDAILVNLIGINWLINAAESWVVWISTIDATAAWLSTLVDFVSFYVSRWVIAGEETCFVAVRVASESASDESRAIISHLGEVSDVMTVLLKK